MNEQASAESIFFAALERKSSKERLEYLDQACANNPQLRAQVERLLTAQANAGDFLDSSDLGTAQTGYQNESAQENALSATQAYSIVIEKPDVIVAGKYRLLEKLGEGGMGSVWAAEQREPVRRKVAIKLIKSGMDSKAVLARFEQERQALAVMDHPNIAKVFDGGVAQDGRPFFVMELVKGTPITEFCDARKLSPRERLELFVPVCLAIQHAHQKGIIHRDIKPSNVLIALYDDKAVPKVIDFGVAKATGTQLTEQTLNTGIGTVVGTPEYMSPEQATLNNLDIDTRSDVYSLGVMLYELLVGSPPFRSKELQKAGLLEILRVVREEDPPRPSTKLSSSETLPSISANRSIEPTKLSGLLRNELDWIVMKALEKDRSRRYESANGFAADILRYLTGEPVLAHPPGGIYRIRKLIRRHRGLFLAATVVMLTFLGGAIGTLIGLAKAIEARDAEAAQRKIAEANERRASESGQQERIAREAEKKERDAAIVAQQQAMTALRSMTDEVIGKLLGQKKSLGKTEREFLVSARKQWASFVAASGDSETARFIRAESMSRQGQLLELLGELNAAINDYREAVRILRSLVESSPKDARFQHELAKSHYNLAGLLSDVGNNKEAIANYQSSASVTQALVDLEPQNLAYNLLLSKTQYSIGAQLAFQGQFANALSSFERALRIQQQLNSAAPNSELYRHELAYTLLNMGRLHREMGKLDAAENSMRQSIFVSEQLVKDFSSNPKYRLNLSATRQSLGTVLKHAGKTKQALAELELAVANFVELVKEFPSVPEYRAMVARSQMNCAASMADQGKLKEAEAMLREAILYASKLCEDVPSAKEYKRLIANLKNELAMQLNQQRRFLEAEKELHSAIEIINRLCESDLAQTDYQVDRSLFFANLSEALCGRGQPEAALEWSRKATKSADDLVTKIGRIAKLNRVICAAYSRQAGALMQLKQFSEALKSWDRAIEFSDAPSRQELEVQRRRCAAQVKSP